MKRAIKTEKVMVCDLELYKLFVTDQRKKSDTRQEIIELFTLIRIC